MAIFAGPMVPLQLDAPVSLDLFGRQELWPAPPMPSLRLPWWSPREQPSLLESVGWADTPRWGAREDAWLARSLDPYGLPQPVTVTRWEDLSDNAVPPPADRRFPGWERVGAVVSTRQALVLRSQHAAYLVQVADPGYTIVHVATGLMASFFMEHDGFGVVFAKAYSNAFVPPGIPDRVPERYFGHGVGRRLYLAAEALWPEMRWRDRAVRGTTRRLRAHLHAANPYAWQSMQCPCSPLWPKATRDELGTMAHRDIPVRL